LAGLIKIKPTSSIWTILSASLLIVGACWIWLSRSPEGAAINSHKSPYIGFQAPDFSSRTLEGEIFRLSNLKGKTVVLNFWASWCPPCRIEMPALQRLYRDYQDDGLVVLSVNTTNQNNLSDVEEFVRSRNINFPVLLDMDGNISTIYQNQALPTTFFIDRNGIIRDRVIGGPISEALLKIKAEKLLENN